MKAVIDGLPADWVTARGVVALIDRPRASDTVTWIEKLPAEVGTQERVGAFELLHPVGKPAYT